MAKDKLLLFITSNIFATLCGIANAQNEKLREIAALPDGGICVIADKSVTKPSTPK